MTVILGTWATEIRKLWIWGQPRQKFNKFEHHTIGNHDSTQLSSQSTREAEIKRITLPGQPRQKHTWESILKGKSWAWCHVPVICVMARSMNRTTMVQAGLGKIWVIVFKIIRDKSAGSVAQEVERLLWYQEALYLNHRTE
jgi:hypothetical protein